MKMSHVLLSLAASVSINAFAYDHEHEHEAAGFTSDELIVVATLAKTDLLALNRGITEENIEGLKMWKSEDDARVRIYVSDLAVASYLFLCHKHDAKMECHLQ